MKPLQFFLGLFCFLFLVPSTAQQSQNFYRYDDGRVKISTKTGIKDTLIFHSDVQDDFAMTSGAISLVLGILVPKLVENVPKLFYNPENYIKESLVSRSFLHRDGSFTRLGELHHIEYRKMAGDEPLALFNFTIGDTFMDNGYLDIELASAKINHTAVQLTSQNHNLNVVVEVFFHYYDAKQLKLVHVVEPFVINNAVTGPLYQPKDQKIRLIPKFALLESIEVKVTEVNARKKDWDAYLSLYQEHSGKLSGYLLGLINQ
ncbi:hypothetical protein [Allomuricauda sp. d1]|uniref:hypothetical protein n=1 Tax=Allomuricauda sp. d1 TaxID=3136725 RepID=UPI0031E103F3